MKIFYRKATGKLYYSSGKWLMLRWQIRVNNITDYFCFHEEHLKEQDQMEQQYAMHGRMLAIEIVLTSYWFFGKGMNPYISQWFKMAWKISLSRRGWHSICYKEKSCFKTVKKTTEKQTFTVFSKKIWQCTCPKQKFL